MDLTPKHVGCGIPYVFVVASQGYVYGCTSDICESMGQCTCSIEERDLDGSSSVSSNSIVSAAGQRVNQVDTGTWEGFESCCFVSAALQVVELTGAS